MGGVCDLAPLAEVAGLAHVSLVGPVKFKDMRALAGLPDLTIRQ